MPTQRQSEAMNQYSRLVAEAVGRLHIVEHTVNNGAGLHVRYGRELCFLQLRKVCELIALGCLVVHGDIKETGANQFQKEHSADKIMKALERLHPHFYPEPAGLKKENGFSVLSRLQVDYLTKEDLLSLYGSCGDVLHVGSLKRLLKGGATEVDNYDDVVMSARKADFLLRGHYIGLFDQKTSFGCMRDPQTPERFHTFIMESLPGPPPGYPPLR